MNEHEYKWFKRWHALAGHVSDWSKDPTTKVGAVIVGRDHRQIAMGYNGFPPLIRDIPERYADRPTKYKFTQHAERNALDNAQFSCEGGTLVTTMFPCIECAKSVISKGIVCVVTPAVPEPLPGEWSWRNDCPLSIQMFEESGVRIVWLNDREELVEHDSPYVTE